MSKPFDSFVFIFPNFLLYFRFFLLLLLWHTHTHTRTYKNFASFTWDLWLFSASFRHKRISVRLVSNMFSCLGFSHTKKKTYAKILIKKTAKNQWIRKIRASQTWKINIIVPFYCDFMCKIILSTHRRHIYISLLFFIFRCFLLCICFVASV